MTPICEVYRLGLAAYQPVWELQERLAQEIAAGQRLPALLLLEHPHTYTFGRRGQANNLLWDAAELQRRGVVVHWVDRGGDVTYHGPGQLVGYPLLPLGSLHPRSPARSERGDSDLGTEKDRSTSDDSGAGPESGAAASGRLPQADYVGYLRKLEEALIMALLNLGLAAAQIDGLTGVWVQPDVLSRCRSCAPDLKQPPAKIAAIGVKVDARGVSRHGFALNVDPDLSYWDGIVGCGLAGYPAASLAELLKPAPSLERVCGAVIEALGAALGYRMVEREFTAGDLTTI